MREAHNSYKLFPVSLSIFSLTPDLLFDEYLNTQKYGLFCSLVDGGKKRNNFQTSIGIFRLHLALTVTFRTSTQ